MGWDSPYPTVFTKPLLKLWIWAKIPLPFHISVYSAYSINFSNRSYSDKLDIFVGIVKFNP